MNLIEINKDSIEELLQQHDVDGGNKINESLGKLFLAMSDESNESEVSIKVAALNQLYSTAIQYIKPVVKKILSEVPSNHTDLGYNNYITLVDKISNIEWTSEKYKKKYSRNNLSFSSKYVHFLSNGHTPIYDSYVWLVMVAYLKEKGIEVNISAPNSYSEFHELFTNFKTLYQLESYSNYQIDKFLWQHGKNMLTEIMTSQDTDMNNAKSILRRCVKNLSCKVALTRTAALGVKT